MELHLLQLGSCRRRISLAQRMRAPMSSLPFGLNVVIVPDQASQLLFAARRDL
jgi:hypothetical protein